MAKIRTFVDSGVLISAARGDDQLSEAAFAILDDPNRVLISSQFVRLEVLPKAKFNKRREEAAFYDMFFESLTRGRLVGVSRSLVQSALEEAARAGLSAVDALHVAAARRARCTELVTAEKPGKPVFRVARLTVLTIRRNLG